MRRLLLIPVVLSAVAAGAACTKPAATGLPTAQHGASPSAAASAAGDPHRFVRCLRAHGQDVPDPPAGERVTVPEPETSAQRAALKACVHFLPDLARADPPATAQELEKLRAFAVCMRAHDVPMDDPKANEPGGGKMQIHGRFEYITRAQLNADPGWKAALAACRDRLPDNHPESADYVPQPGKEGGK